MDSTGPGVPKIRHNSVTTGMTENEREMWEERSAIMEYDGGLSRREAEQEARLMIAEMRRLAALRRELG